LPALSNGYITLSSFTTLPKLNQPLLECWAEILLRIPGSRIMIGANRLQYPARMKWLFEIFNHRGVESERITVLDNQTMSEYLASHHRADLMLDTFPVNGHTVICHGLWMGVPPVTLAGSTYSQRLCCSVLNNLALPELIANSAEQYISIATDWAGNLPRLAELRQGLRDRMRRSPLMDGPRFTQNLESAYRQMWQRWCRNSK
jgi:protein O-GlcNAc transferase